MRAADTYIAKHLDRWNELLLENESTSWSESKNFTHLIDSLTFDILGDLCFGRSFETKEPGKNDLKMLPLLISKYLRFTYAVTIAPNSCLRWH